MSQPKQTYDRRIGTFQISRVETQQIVDKLSQYQSKIFQKDN